MNATVKDALLVSGVDPAQRQRAKLAKAIGLVARIPTVDQVVPRAAPNGHAVPSARPVDSAPVVATPDPAPPIPTVNHAVPDVAPAHHRAPASRATATPAAEATPAATAAAAAAAPAMRAAAATIAPARIAPRKGAPAAAIRSLRWPAIWTLVVAAVILAGMNAHLERYITPQRGIGYWLGITGGSMMLLLLLYSARKRVSWLSWLGGIPAWFEFHMVLGVVGPVLILFHANFSLGATNSNVALFSMLLVAGSGVFGRYVYTRLHASLDGKEDTLEQLKAVGDRLRAQTASIEFLPGLLESIEQVEKKLIEPPKGRAARFMHLFSGAIRMAVARHMVRRAIREAVQRALLRESSVIAAHAQRIAKVARRYSYRRLDAGRRVSEYQAYTELFALWHVLHIPLFFMLLIAGIAHVIAVNVY